MPINRFFADIIFETGQIVALKDQEFHHLTRVVRVKPGEEIDLVNGKNQLAQAKVIGIQRSHAELQILSLEEGKPNPKKIILAQALPRLNRLEFILEKGTELGAAEFWLFPSDLSERVKITANQENRLKLICINAMKQCGRLDLPEMLFKPALEEWKPLVGSCYFGDLREGRPSFAEEARHAYSPIIIFIGPEAGFSENEKSLLETKFRAKGVKLHDNILRVDTAALTALALATQ